MLSFNEIRKGSIIVLEGEPYVVVSAEFLRKQQRRPVMRTILKSVKSDAVKEHSFQQSDKVAEADIERVQCQFLYRNGDSFAFMNQATYEQFEMDAAALGDAAAFLIDGQTVEVLLFEGQPVSVTLPIKIDRKVIEAPPGVRGDTSTNAMKEVVIEGDTKVKAPLFVNEGDIIRIDTRTGDYVERVQR